MLYRHAGYTNVLSSVGVMPTAFSLVSHRALAKIGSCACVLQLPSTTSPAHRNEDRGTRYRPWRSARSGHVAAKSVLFAPCMRIRG
jgi:hypothetical protein